MSWLLTIFRRLQFAHFDLEAGTLNAAELELELEPWFAMMSKKEHPARISIYRVDEPRNKVGEAVLGHAVS
jgi:hypothetical protein